MMRQKLHLRKLLALAREQANVIFERAQEPKHTRCFGSGFLTSKKALSAVVATVLLILLTVTAAVIIAGFLVPFVRSNLEKSSECLPYDTYFAFDESFENFNCYVTATDATSSPPKSDGDIRISLRAKNDKKLAENIGGFNLALFASTEGVSEDKRFASVNVRSMGATTTADTIAFGSYGSGAPLSIPGAGDIASYTLKQPSTIPTDKPTYYNRAEIHPILKDGKICEKPSGKTKLVPCAK